MGIAHALQQGQDDFASLVRIGGCEDAFPNALTDDLGEQRRALFENRLVHFQADNSVAVGVPDTPQLDYISLVGTSQTVQRIEEALEFFDGGQMRIMDNGQERLFHLLLYPFDERFQQRPARVEVVMESPAGNPYLVQDILDRHLLVSLGKHQSLGGIQNLSALGSNCFWFDGSSHCFPLISKQTVFLLIIAISFLLSRGLRDSNLASKDVLCYWFVASRIVMYL